MYPILILPFSCAVTAGEAPGIAFGSLADSNATLSSSPAQRPPMAETRPAQFGSVPASSNAGGNAGVAATKPVPAAAAATSAATSAVPKVNLASLDFNKFFQSGGDGDASPEASPAAKPVANNATQQMPQQQQQQQNALHASTASNAPGGHAAPRRPSTYENANAMSPRMMAAGLPPSGTPGMPHHINARPFSPANMNKAIPNPQAAYYQGGGGMGMPGSPSTFVPGQLPPGAYANAPQGAGGYSGAPPPGTPGPAGNKMNGVPGGPPSAAGAGPRQQQQQTTPYLQNRQAPPNAAQHQIHHQHNRSIGSGSPRPLHASTPGQPTAQPFYPGQNYGGQQWVSRLLLMYSLCELVTYTLPFLPLGSGLSQL